MQCCCDLDPIRSPCQLCSASCVGASSRPIIPPLIARRLSCAASIAVANARLVLTPERGERGLKGGARLLGARQTVNGLMQRHVPAPLQGNLDAVEVGDGA